MPDPEAIRSMFASIASRYDRANDVLSAGIHRSWRHRAVQVSGVKPGDRVLDVATGTGLLAMAFRDAGAKVTGTDFVEEMLAIARRKAPDIDFRQGDALALPFPDKSFDVASIAFGIRNVADPQTAIAEMARVARRIVILEFGRGRGWMSSVFRVYQRHVLPRVGGLITGRPDAYRYLEESSARFPSADDFVALIRSSAKFGEIRYEALTFGTAWLYWADASSS